MKSLATLFTKYPEMAVYLAIGIGYLIGKLKFHGVGFGVVTGSLLGGIFIGNFFHVPVSDQAKAMLFLLFLFGIGYSVGPSFFQNLKGDGWRWVLLGVFVPIVGLLTAYTVARSLKLDPGYAAGLLSGALTESPTIGTAAEAIRGLPVSDDQKQQWISHIAVADAICYIFGTLGVILVCSSLGPKLLGIDLRAESKKVEDALGIRHTKLGVASAWQPIGFRAYTIPTNVLEAGDTIAVLGRTEALINLLGPLSRETTDPELLDIPVASFGLYVTSDRFAGKTLGEISENIDEARSVLLRRITRGEQTIPIGPGTVIQRGDTLEVSGSQAAVERLAPLVGRMISPTEDTDLTVLGVAIFLGVLVGGVLTVPIAHLRITLGTSVGTLLAGVTVGWLRSVKPWFGRIPDGAIHFMKDIGLAAFVAMVGLKAGPVFINAVRQYGYILFLGGIVVTLTPLITGLFFGRYVVKLNPLLLLGGLAGAQTMIAGAAAVQEKSGSPVATLGYSYTVALGHILLTTWGTIIVALMT